MSPRARFTLLVLGCAAIASALLVCAALARCSCLPLLVGLCAVSVVAGVVGVIAEMRS